jgi:hypothetical protein
MSARAALDFNRDMRKSRQVREPFFVEAWIIWMVGHQRDDCGKMTRADTPKMEIGNTIAVLFKPLRNVS